MTDEQLAASLHELKTRGPEALADIKALLKREGGWSRLISLIPVPKKKRPPSKAPTTPIPDDFPDAEAKEKACGYWQKLPTGARPDLVAAIEKVASDFHAYHLANNTRAKSWAGRWVTWYAGAPEKTRAPRFGPGSTIAVVFEPTSIAGWVRRLEISEGAEGEAPAWSATWGAKRGEPNCKIPEEAIRLFDGRRRKKA